ncbi:GHKL domain-containing protein [Anaeromicropila populeti]|nr:GHKL domain-containing protein [Anaeromicropila populeti]
MFCVISEFTQYLADLSVMLISEAGIINMKVNMSKIHLLSAILGSLLKILAYYLFLRRSVYKKLKTATALQIGGYIMISSVSLIIIHTMIVLVNKERNTMDYIMIITTLIGVVILNVYFIVYIQYIYTANSLKNKLELSEQRITISYEYYKEVEDKYISLQKIIHDMKNHIQILENIYAEGATASTRKYREDICGFLELFGPKCYTSNIILNIIINHKVLLALKDNIKLLCEIDAVDLQFISEFDMTTIFCNLLDNAIAECKLLRTDREIYFKIRQFNSFIIINIVNKMSKSIHTWEEQIAFRRRLEMGTGLSNVKAAVENYNGDMRMYFEKDLFEVNISICSR